MIRNGGVRCIGIILCIIVLKIGNVYGKPAKLKPSQILTISDGLSHDGVTAIYEDSRGYVWVATYEGLNRYDGYGFKVYRNTPKNTFLLSNRIRTINEDKKGNLWIGTDEGVVIYDYQNESFKNIYSTHFYWKGISGPIVRKVIFGDNGLVYCTTEDAGLLVFDEDYELVETYKTAVVGNGDLKIFDGVSINENKILLATSDGLIEHNTVSKTFITLAFPLVEECQSIVFSNSLIVTTVVNGIVIFKLNKDGELSLVSRQLEDHQLNSVAIDKLNNVWVGGIFSGLFQISNLDKLLKGEATIKHYKPKKGFLRVSGFFESKDNGCWVGSFNKGVYRFPLVENPFKAYNISLDQPHSIKSNNILSVDAYSESKVLVSANLGGVGLFNFSTGQFEKLPFNINEDFSRRIGSLLVAENNDVWFGIAHSGLYRVRAGSTKVEPINEFNEGLQGVYPRQVIEDKLGRIWIVGLNNVYRIVLDIKGSILKIESINDNPIFKDRKFTHGRYIYQDPQKNIMWVGTDIEGLFQINLEKGKALSELDIINYRNTSGDGTSLSSNFVSCILRTPKGELWIATEEGGICRAHEEKENLTFQVFTEEDGLSNNVVKSIICDSVGDLWISTNIGLNKFNIEKSHFIRFRKEDGLPFDAFDYASQVLENEQIFLAGFNGFCYFNPNEIKDDNKLPYVDLTDFKVSNTLINVGDSVDGRVLLPKHLASLKRIELKHAENIFSFTINALHYSNPSNYYLRYRLLPLNEEWIEVTSDERNIYYSGLQAGEYQFELQVSNVFGEWTEPHILKVSVLPPWYKTLWAILIYAVFVIIMVVIIITVFIYLQKLRHTIEIEQLEKSKSKAVSDAKFKFFSNISHEFKTPLTLISGPIDILLDKHKNDEVSYRKLSLVKRQSKKMSQLVDQVHDFQKSDKNLLKMNYDNFNFKQFIKELIVDFEYLATENGKKLILKGPDQDVFVSADKDKLEKVINNLLNNAFKFTKKGDCVSIDYSLADENLNLKISDTGKGIDAVDLPHVFERFYQSSKKHSAYTGGSGIGLAFSKRLVEMHYGYIFAESTFGEGATFTLKLPIVTDAINVKDQEQERTILEIEKKSETSLLRDTDFDFKSIQVNDSSKDVLIYFAEDNDDMRQFTEESLSRYFKVKSFINGQECIDAMETEWPDIVLSDVLMPVLNGFELCKIVKSDIKTSHIPVVLLTACTASNDKLEGLKTGADAYVTKPFDLQYLISTIESILNGRKSLRERYQSDFPLALEKKLVGTNDNVFLEKLYTLMTENLDNQDLDLDNFARELYLNRTHFYQKVKQLTNQTPFELLKSYRLKKAAELLINGNLSVTEVCERTGFKSRTHFSKIFKQRYGVTPSKYPSE